MPDSRESRQLRHVLTILTKRAAAIEATERLLARQREERDDLIRQAMREGASERTAGRAGGVSGPWAHMLKQRDEEANV